MKRLAITILPLVVLVSCSTGDDVDIQRLQERMEKLEQENATLKEETAISTGESVIMYLNEMQKIQFQYPDKYDIVADEVYLARDSIPDWYRIILRGNSLETALTVEINPDGYGPIFADKIFTVGEYLGSLYIASEEEYHGEINTSDGRRILVANSFEVSNGNTYYWRFSYLEGGENLDEVFSNILKSAKLLE